ncbi:MAG: hypothetical protein CSB55_01190 [Candidatus Cloacimonadota bacterium]|nr:MAG: hypothetical protein CSB55_01190 [Candidatus Cloacimonadota bacterium]
MENQKNIIIFFGSVLLFSILFFGTLFLFDPINVFGNRKNPDYFLTGNMRFLAFGIINSQDFDSVILGSSLLVNTSSRETVQYLEGKFINISATGSDFFERAIILKYV